MSKRICNNNISSYQTERHRKPHSASKRARKNLQEFKEFKTKRKIRFGFNIAELLAVGMMWGLLEGPTPAKICVTLAILFASCQVVIIEED